MASIFNPFRTILESGKPFKAYSLEEKYWLLLNALVGRVPSKIVTINVENSLKDLKVQPFAGVFDYLTLGVPWLIDRLANSRIPVINAIFPILNWGCALVRLGFSLAVMLPLVPINLITHVVLQLPLPAFLKPKEPIQADKPKEQDVVAEKQNETTVKNGVDPTPPVIADSPIDFSGKNQPSSSASVERQEQDKDSQGPRQST